MQVKLNHCLTCGSHHTEQKEFVIENTLDGSPVFMATSTFKQQECRDCKAVHLLDWDGWD